MPLADLAADAAAAEATSPGFMEPGAKLKKKRGPKGPWKHKTQSQQADSSADVTGPEKMPGASVTNPIDELMPLTKQLTEFYSGVLVQIAEDERAALNAETKQVMAHSTAVCMQQYFPNALGSHAALIVLLCVVGQTSITAVRYRRENLEKLREEKRQREAASGMQ